MLWDLPLFHRRLSSSPVVSKGSLRTAHLINFGTSPSLGQTSTRPCMYSHVSVDNALIRPVLHRLPLHHNFTVDLVDEVKQWVQFASHVVPHPAAETLVAWWIGINDTGDTLNRNVRATSRSPITRLCMYLPAHGDRIQGLLGARDAIPLWRCRTSQPTHARRLFVSRILNRTRSSKTRTTTTCAGPTSSSTSRRWTAPQTTSTPQSRPNTRRTSSTLTPRSPRTPPPSRARTRT